MTELEKVWNFCEQKKNACDKNVEVIGMDNMLTPPWQTNMGMSNAYWSVQKCIEIIEEERKTNADKIRAMSDEELAEFLETREWIDLITQNLPRLKCIRHTAII